MNRKEKLFRETEPRVFTTRPDNPEDGRIFVWAWTEWFEREEAENGAITFVPVADNERQLRRWLRLNRFDQDLVETTGRFDREVKSEFLEQLPLFSESPENSSQGPFRELNTAEDVEHY